MKKNSTGHLRALTVTAMLCAAAYLVTFVFHFKVSFLTFDLKDTLLALTALLFGPWYGLLSAAVVAFLEFVTVSDTGLYGLLMNFLSSGVFVLAAGLVYKYKRSLTGAVLGMVLAVVSTTAVMMLANWLITPFYMGVEREQVYMGVEREQVAAMIPTLLLPFNLCKSVMNAAAVLLLYKPLITALRHTGLLPKQTVAYRADVKTVVITVTAVVLIAVTAAVLVLVLGGTAQWF